MNYSRGADRAIKVNVPNETYDVHALRIKRMLRDTHFRSRYDSQGPQAAERVTRYYRLTETPWACRCHVRRMQVS